MSIGIDVQHPIVHVHSQNRLAESFIKRLQLIARPLLLKSKLPLSAWGHAIIHAANLIRLRPTANHDLSPLQLAKGYQPNISHLRVFGCTIYVPIAPTHRPKLGPQHPSWYLCWLSICIYYKLYRASYGESFYCSIWRLSF